MFKSKPWLLFYLRGSFVIFVEHLSGFFLVQMVGDKILGDILALGHGEPVFSSGVLVDVVIEIIQFVLDDPQT